MSARNSSRADVLLLLVTGLAAISWMFSREAVLLMPPLLFLSLRFLLAGTILVAIGPAPLLHLSGEQLFQALRVGLVFATAMSCWIMGLHFSASVGVGAFLTSLGVVLVPVFGRLLFAERPPASTWLALPVAITGLALLSLNEQARVESGHLFFITAAAIFAIYFNLNTRAANHRIRRDAAGRPVQHERVPARLLTAIVMLCVGTSTAALSIALEPWRQALSDFNAHMLLWIVLSAVIGSAARFLLQTYAQSLSTHSHGVVIMVVEPVWTALFAALWFGESMSAQQLAGCALVFAALVISRGRAVGQAVRAWLRLA